MPIYEVSSAERARLWADLRSRYGQIAPIRLEPDLTAWLLLGYEENLEVLRDWATYSRDTRRWNEIRDGRRKLGSGLRPTMAYRSSALYADGAEHARLIAPIADALAQVPEARVRRDITEIADHLIDAFCERGEADLVRDYTTPLPALLVNRLFGLGDVYGHALGHLSASLWASDGTVGAEAVARMRDYFVGLVQRKRVRPGDDLPSRMMAHEAALSDAEMADQLIVLAGAGHEPTANLLGNVLRALLADSRIGRDHASGGLLLDEVIDHVAWSEPPLQMLAARFPTRDVEIDGTLVAEGEPLIIGFAAAHADPRLGAGAVPAESALPPGHNSAHLMWGVGTHRCPAQSLALRIVRVGVERLLERLPGVRLAVPAEELRWREELFVRGLVSLPVRFPAVEAPPRSPAADEDDAEGGYAEVDGGEEPVDLLGRVLRWWRGVRAASTAE
ncbi:cytochrome P450 [Marinactinospora thermotolerans]|uniref:cytochrome P450 n=1 Tax=Marinactinospora thermotolerans TaxID=531310 RepID=UPI001F2A5C58|nr:cytochrome P450 [Marinactinospora thermotolerans]